MTRVRIDVTQDDIDEGRDAFQVPAYMAFRRLGIAWQPNAIPIWVLDWSEGSEDDRLPISFYATVFVSRELQIQQAAKKLLETVAGEELSDDVADAIHEFEEALRS